MIRTEVVTQVAPLGIRFWDDLTRAVVRDGLSVRAWPEGRPAQAVGAAANASGVWVFRGLSGMRAFEGGHGDRAYWDAVRDGTNPALAPRRPFLVEVIDGARRFLPARVRVELPVKGVFPWPPEGLTVGAGVLTAGAVSPAIPLFSAPHRAVAEVAVVRAELRDVASELPVPDAVVELNYRGAPVGCGVSDEMGRVLVWLRYPEPGAGFLGSPLESPADAGRVDGLRWELGLRVYRRALPATSTRREPPEMRALFSQPLGVAVDRRVPTEAPLESVTLRFGEELVLRSRDAAGRHLWTRSAV
jgi:hypothetical protein